MNPAQFNTPFTAFPHGMLEATFPFYLQWDREMKLLFVGRSLLKAMPGAIAGVSLEELFHLRRPVGKWESALFEQDGSTLYLLEARSHGMLLRGQVHPLADGSGFLMLANPWIADPDQIEKLGLTMADFAVHDQTMDMLQVVQTYRMTIDDLKELNQTLTAQRVLLQEQRTEARKLALVASRSDNAVIITDD